ncbi:MAG: trypsin-like peptidase domain-containing protein, partial [Frankiaceae bacterium]|nr:trypsin-like peptidase domain-containing protein [Frankiaceae bacterium]
MSDDLFWPPLSGGGDDDRDGRQSAVERSSEPATGDPTMALPQQASDDPEPPASRRTVATVVVAATAFVFGAGGVAVGAAIEHGRGDGTSTPITSGSTVSAQDAAALTTNPKSYAGIAAKVLPSVVSINVTSGNQGDTGSGIVLQSNGYILTNNHVVSAAVNGGSVSVTFNDGSSADARIVGTDSLDDLAVIK